MNRTDKLLSLMAALLLALVVAAQSAAAKGDYIYTFDKDLAPWGSGTDSFYKEVRLELRAEYPSIVDPIINSFANLKATMSSPDSAVWMAALFPGYGEDLVNVKFSAKDTGNCAGCRLIAYVGTLKPTKAAQFTAVQSLYGQPLGENWQTYKLSTIVKAEGTIVVAMGVQGGPDVANSTISAGFDNISVTAVPIPFAKTAAASSKR